MGRVPGTHETFSKFFEAPSRELFRDLLRDHPGELPNLDFKSEWPARPELARHVLGMLNSGGGCLVVGVSELVDKTLTPSGLAAMTDKVDIHNSVKKYLPQETHTQLTVLDFSYEASEYPKLVGKKFQVLIVDFNPLLVPVVTSGSTTDLREGAIYVRRLASTEEANHDELKTLIDKHIEAATAIRPALDLKVHLEELRKLYDEVPKYQAGLAYAEQFAAMFGRSPNAPKESFEQFVLRMIAHKKSVIETALGAVSRT
jgi:hypothetical protein